MLEDPHQAIEWLMQLTSVTPTDAQVLAKLGDLYDNEGDKSQAFQYYYEVKKKNLFFVDILGYSSYWKKENWQR